MVGGFNLNNMCVSTLAGCMNWFTAIIAWNGEVTFPFLV